MSGLDDFRNNNPAYANIPDDQLADALYKKYYANQMSRNDFNAKLGLTAERQPTDFGALGTDALNKVVTSQAWADYVNRPANTPSAGTQLMRDATAQMLGATQGTSPYPQQYGDPVGEVMELDSGYSLMPTGGKSAADLIPWGDKRTEGYVAIMGPDGKLMAYPRSQGTDESLPSSLGRFLAPGMLAGPVTTPLRAAATQGPSAAAKALQQFQNQNIPADLAAVMNNRGLNIARNTLKDFWPSAGLLDARDTTRLGAASNRAADLAKQYGDALTNVEAGGGIQSGLQRFATGERPATMTPAEILTQPTRFSSFTTKAEEVYNRVNSLVGPEASVQLGETLPSLTSILSKFQNVELGQALQGTRGAFLQKLAGILKSGTLSWSDAQALRSEIGKLTRGRQVIEGLDIAELKGVYAALSNDMRLAAEAAGGTKAATAWDRANQYYRLGLDRINGTLASVLNAKSPEAAYRKLIDMMQAGKAAESEQALAAIRKSVTPEEWGDVASTIIHGLGEPKPGMMNLTDASNFTASDFVTNYAKLSDGAKAQIFGGAGREQLRSALDEFADVMSRLKQVERASNRSLTASGVNMFGSAAALWADPTAAITTFLGANMSARAFTNPTFVRWATGFVDRMSKARAYAGNSFNAMNMLPAEITRLNQLARLDPSLRDVAAALSAATAEENQ